MKKEMMMTANAADTKNIIDSIRSYAERAKQPIVMLSIYYSKILEEKISVKQTLLLLNAQISFVLAIFPANFSLILRFLFIVWFATAVVQCKRSGLRTSDEHD
jgi:acyl-CoA reductase-like NAD-dependent aldehyde dehydrogenase